MSDIRVDTSEPFEEGLVLHHLPVEIKHTGMARVNGFFRPQPTDLKFQDKPVMEAAFRGRRLRGVQVSVPAGYSGVIFREDEHESSSPRRYQEESDDYGSNSRQGGPNRTWALHAKYDSFMYWTRQSQPLKQDKVMKWMEWTEIADKLHRPITEEQLKNPAKRARSAPKQSTETTTTESAEKEDDAAEPTKSKKRKLEQESSDPSASGAAVDEESAEPPSKKQKIDDGDAESGSAPSSPSKKQNRRHSMPARSSPKKKSK